MVAGESIRIKATILHTHSIRVLGIVAEGML